MPLHCVHDIIEQRSSGFQNHLDPVDERLERSVGVERREPFERPQCRSRTTITNTFFLFSPREIPGTLGFDHSGLQPFNRKIANPLFITHHSLYHFD